MKSSNYSLKSILFPLFIILWVTGIIAAYYVVHKPWGIELKLEPFMAFLDLILVFLFISLAGGLGRRIMGKLSPASALESLVMNIAIGLGTLSLIVLIVGMVGFIRPSVTYLGLCIGLFVLYKDILNWLSDLRSLFIHNNKLSVLEKIAFVFILLVVFMNLLKVLAPPLKWDSLVYHLQIPQQYVSDGRVFFYKENIYAGFPETVEMLYTWMVSLGSVTTAAALCWGVGVMTLVGVEGFTRRILGKGVAWLAPAILLTGFSVSQAMNWAYLDLWIMLFGLVMIISLDYFKSTSNRVWLVWAGVAGGFALGTKLTAGILLLIGAILLLPFWERLSANKRYSSDTQTEAKKEISSSSHVQNKSSIMRLLVDLFIFGAVAAIVASPWFIKNFILAGNPFYPVLFSGNQLDPWRQVFNSEPSSIRSLLRDIFLPLEMTIYGIENSVVIGKPAYGASIGSLLLALIPAIFLTWSQNKRNQRDSLVRLLVILVSTWFLWSIAAHFADELMRTRHYYGVFGAMAVLAVAGYKSASRINFHQIRLGRILSILIILNIFFASYCEIVSFVQSDPLPILFGEQSIDDYLDQELGWYSIAMKNVNALPANSMILFLFEPRTLYCDMTCIMDSTLDTWWYLMQVGEDSDGIADIMMERGVTHVLIYEKGIDFLSKANSVYDYPDWEELEVYRENYLDLVIDLEGNYSLYTFEYGGEQQ